MPRSCEIDPKFWALVATQDYVVHRDQALAHGLSRHALANRIAYHGWHRLVGCVYLTHPGEPSRRQMLIAALLYAGDDAAIDDVDACRFHGLSGIPIDQHRVHVAVPQSSAARSTGFVVVRRSNSPIQVVSTERLRYVDAATAVVAACRRPRSARSVLAAMSDAVQRRIATYEELVTAHVRASPRNAAPTDSALEQIGAGVRSASEGDFRLLAEASRVLPSLRYNCLLRLPSGLLVSPDALAEDAALVHETNGRRAHARLDLFEDMQKRHNAMTEAGLVVLHNSPNRIHLQGRQALAEFERCYVRLAGRGMPPGVEILRSAA